MRAKCKKENIKDFHVNYVNLFITIINHCIHYLGHLFSLRFIPCSNASLLTACKYNILITYCTNKYISDTYLISIALSRTC